MATIMQYVNSDTFFNKLLDVPIFYSDEQVGAAFREFIEYFKNENYQTEIKDGSPEMELYNRFISALSKKIRQEDAISIQDFVERFKGGSEYEKKKQYFSYYKHIKDLDALLMRILEEFSIWVISEGEHCKQKKSYGQWVRHLSKWLTIPNEKRIIREFQPVIDITIPQGKETVENGRYISAERIKW